MRLFIKLTLLFYFLTTALFAQDLDEGYILEWKKFYPSKAAKMGMHDAIFVYENRSSRAILGWLVFNKRTLTELSSPNTKIHPIDGRLLRVQAQSEIDRFEILATQRRSLQLYTKLISNSLVTIFDANYLLISEKRELLCKRLIAIEQLSLSARANLQKVPKQDLENGLEDLSKTLHFLKNELSSNLKTSNIFRPCQEFDSNLTKAVKSINLLQVFATTLLKNSESPASTLGRKEYDRRLKLYTDSELTAARLEEMALIEIKTVKELMLKVSLQYIQEVHSDQKLPKNESDIIKLALADMEKDAPLNSTDYLTFWQQLADSALAFIKEKDIATLPKNNTLKIQTAPESAGAAARIGWVASAPSFDPNPITTLNLPSIPETLPKQEQIDFWASFNKPFNRMIVIHELYPGHYMQLKISRETAHPLRLLFPYGIYTEGWATFTEKVLLDAGWEKGNHLTHLAHLRKRLENANRSYTSVQVHCNNWNQEQVMKFSTETSLLAPQFAKSLWGRIKNSPMQLTSYFLGGAQFTQLLKTEKERLGDKFDLKLFMDTIMKAGAIPIEEFYLLFEQINPN